MTILLIDLLFWSNPLPIFQQPDRLEVDLHPSRYLVDHLCTRQAKIHLVHGCETRVGLGHPDSRGAQHVAQAVAGTTVESVLRLVAPSARDGRVVHD